MALYEDTMARRLAVGLGRDGEPIHLDLDFLDGTKGGHVSISGISGVATKTSTALALVRLMLEHEEMRRRVRVLVFNVKGEDLLHLDRPNARYAARPDREELDRRWAALGLAEPGPFPSVGVWAPAAARRRGQRREPPGGRAGVRLDPVRLRGGGAPALLLHRGRRHAQPALLPRGARARGAAAAGGAGERPPREPGPARRRRPGATPRAGRAARRASSWPGRSPTSASWWSGSPTASRTTSGPPAAGRAWVANTAQGTIQAFIRRLQGAAGRLRGLIRADAQAIPRGDAAASEPPVAVVHLTPLHDFAQRFVVGTLLAQTFAGEGGRGPRPDRAGGAGRAQQVRAARGPVADQGDPGRHRPARALAGGDPRSAPSSRPRSWPPR